MNLYAKLRKSGEEEKRDKRVRDRQITSLIDGDDSLKSEEDRFASAEKVILRWDPSLEGSRRSLNWEDSGYEADWWDFESDGRVIGLVRFRDCGSGLFGNSARDVSAWGWGSVLFLDLSFSHGTILQALSINRVDLGYRSVLIFQGQKELFFLLTVFLYGLQRQAHLWQMGFLLTMIRPGKAH